MAKSLLCSVEGCGKNASKREWCAAHYKRWLRHSDPLVRTKAAHFEPLGFAIAAAKMETDDCVIWPFALNAAGYGVATFEGRQRRATHVVLKLLGILPPTPSHEVAHLPVVCHNRACVNPRHLRWATRKENVDDRRLDGTHGRAPVKLTQDQVTMIRDSSLSSRDLAACLPVTDRTIRKIRQGVKRAAGQ
jgi:hypothetical protein